MISGALCKSPGCAPGQCKMIRFGNYCGVTKQEIAKEADGHLNNRLFFMGHTLHGYQQPIREYVNPSCRDANFGRPKLEQFLPPTKNPNADDEEQIDYGRLAENFRNIDVYSGLVDGTHYGRFNRLYYQKKRHMRNPFGTEERFCVPVANNMSYGWWIRDLRELNCTKWYAARERFPQIRGEMTKFVDEMALRSPNFILY